MLVPSIRFAPYGTAYLGHHASRSLHPSRAVLRRWLHANPNDELAGEVRALLTTEPVRHVTYTREYLGWGVFALMAR